MYVCMYQVYMCECISTQSIHCVLQENLVQHCVHWCVGTYNILVMVTINDNVCTMRECICTQVFVVQHCVHL